ncbi:PqiC family protein [Pseudothioclava nitratireducens]|uniref:PqiC family protein n=1 Tax=Pseudothioclava nitratireducens TaxID=1928646 RepID=UPI0023DB5A8A|nr:PqiC family protein [Defluviimonas nitratireducens]MDF1619874.1 PqiC family protein [Defluviimonas nitratireducens]
MTPTRFLTLGLLALAACSDPTATGRYTVDPAQAEKTLPNKLGYAELREVSLPQYAAGQEIIWQTEDGALRSSPDNVWADDPARAVTLSLARQISDRSGATVIAEPWPLAQEPARRIEVRIEQMLPRADQVMQLSGVYFVSPAGYGSGRDIVRRFDLAVPIEAEGPAAIARAQSQAIALLSQKIAALD